MNRAKEIIESIVLEGGVQIPTYGEVTPKNRKKLEDIVAKLEAGKSLSTKDFEVMGVPFEWFLRYSKANEATTKLFHKALAMKLRKNLEGSSK